jgi:hypothetical protein
VCRRLTIVGGVRETLLVWRLGRWEIVRPRRRDRAVLCGPSTSALGACLTRRRKFLALPAKELNSAAGLFAVLALGVPALYGTLRSACSDVALSLAFVGLLLPRLLLPMLVVIPACVYLRRNREFVTLASFGVASTYTGMLYGAFGLVILVTGHSPSKYHSVPVSREASVPFLAFAAVTLIAGVTIVARRRRPRA